MKIIAFNPNLPIPDDVPSPPLEWLQQQGYQNLHSYPIREGVALWSAFHPWQGYALYIPANITLLGRGEDKACLHLYIPTPVALQGLINVHLHVAQLKKLPPMRKPPRREDG